MQGFAGSKFLETLPPFAGEADSLKAGYLMKEEVFEKTVDDYRSS